MEWLKKRLPRKRWKRVALAAGSTLLVALAADMMVVQHLRKITVAPETTRITAPLTADGMPDYVAAYNAEYGRGVTLENNAAAVMFRVYGMQGCPEEWRRQVLPQLGLPATGGPGMIGLMSTLNGANKADVDEKNLVSGAPWKSSEHPRLAAWLDRQEAGLAEVARACERDRYFVPRIAERPFVLSGEYSGEHGEERGVVFEAMDLSLMRRAGDGDFNRFRREALATMKLGRLTAQGGTLLDYLVGASESRRGAKSIVVSMQQGIWSPAEARDLLTDIEALPPLLGPDQVYDHFARWEILRGVCYGSVHGIERLDELRVWTFQRDMALNRRDDAYVPEPGRAWSTVTLGMVVPFNFDQAMRDSNALMDRIISAMRLPTYALRRAATEAIEQELDTYSKARNLLWYRHPGIAVVKFGRYFDTRPMMSLGELARTTEDLARLALALTIYHGQAHAYPENLDELRKAGILSALPLDAFSDKPFVYERRGSGYVLYSVGERNEGEKEVGGNWRVVRVEQ